MNKMETVERITTARLVEILTGINNIKVGIVGDICLDVYWHADMKRSELSRETPHYMLPIVEERMSPGGGANVAANMAALIPRSVEVIGAVGNDWRGRELTRLLGECGIGTSGVVTGLQFSNTYIKPMRHGISDVIYEDPRLDFVSHEPISVDLENALIKTLNNKATNLDILCVSDQLPFGIITARVREHICKLAGQGLRVIVDSRYNIASFKSAVLKPNELEAAAAIGKSYTDLSGVEDYNNVAQALSKQTTCKVFMTIGDKGSIYTDGSQSWRTIARKLNGPLDIVGAGDSSLSGFALALAAGAEPWEAAGVAGLCSEVTVQQIGITGVATREQLLEVVEYA